MKILLISEGVVLKKQGKYYVKDTWVNFPIYISSYVEEFVLLCTSVRVAKNIDPDYKEVDIKRLKVVFLGQYSSYFSYYCQYFYTHKAWSSIIEKNMKRADIIWVRIPSPALKLIYNASNKLNKKTVLFFAGNIMTQSDLIIKYSYLKFLLKAFIKKLSKFEQIASDKASLLYCYSSEISNRILFNESKKMLFRTPIVSEKDFYFRTDAMTSDTIKIIRVSWLLPSKGLEFLIRSVAELKHKGYSVILTIIGGSRDPNYDLILNKLVIDLELVNEVIFIGWKSKIHIGKYFKSHDVHVISSLSEGTPRVLLEGMCKAIPTICTKVGGVEDFIDDGVDSILIKPGSSSSITKAIILLKEDSELRKKISLNGYNSAKLWTIERQTTNVLKDMRDVIDNE